MERRLRLVSAHLEPPLQDEPAADTGALDLLTERQVKQYIIDGFVIVQPKELPGGIDRFASEFYDKARNIAGPDVVNPGSAHRDRTEMLWEELTPEVNAVLADRSTNGALTSLLGPDWIAPPGNSLMHVSQPTDQVGERFPATPCIGRLPSW